MSIRELLAAKKASTLPAPAISASVVADAQVAEVFDSDLVFLGLEDEKPEHAGASPLRVLFVAHYVEGTLDPFELPRTLRFFNLERRRFPAFDAIGTDVIMDVLQILIARSKSPYHASRDLSFVLETILFNLTEKEILSLHILLRNRNNVRP